MSKYIIPTLLLFCLGVFSCKKTQQEKVATEVVQTDFHQKEIPYEGVSQKCDSIITLCFSAKSEHGKVAQDELLMAIVKRFNEDGFLLNQECKVYDDEGLLSVESISYRRDSINLQVEEKVKYLERTGQGYTITYNLVNRFENVETWEKIQQTPRFGLELKAEIRDYAKDKVSISSQVGAIDSVIISREHFYKEDGLLEKSVQYSLGEEISRELIEYNNMKYPIKIIKKIATSDSSDEEIVETREYQYDLKNNPVWVEIYIDGEPVSIMEHNYYFKEAK